MREHRPKWLEDGAPSGKRARPLYGWKGAGGAEVYSLVDPEGKGWLWLGAQGPLLGEVHGLDCVWAGERFMEMGARGRLDAGSALGEFARSFEDKWARAAAPRSVGVSSSFEEVGIYALPGAGVFFEGAEPCEEQWAALVAALEQGGRKAEELAARAGLTLAKAGCAKGISALLEAGFGGNWVLGALAESASGGHLAASALLAKAGDPRYDSSRALCMAAINGHADVARLLAPVSGVEESGALARAAAAGHLGVLETLMDYADPMVDDSLALRVAADRGHVKVVEKLLPASDANALNSQALRNAVESGHAEVVRLLAGACDAKANESAALRYAASIGGFLMVEILLPVSDVRARDSEALRMAARREAWAMVDALWAGYEGFESEFVGVLAKLGSRSAEHVAKYEKLMLESLGGQAKPASAKKRI
jgi:hypothetical protein